MNKQIDEICGRVLDEVVPATWTTIDYQTVKQIQQRTAELTIEGCISEIIKWKSEPFPLDPETAVRMIKEHFGVK